MTIKTKTIPCFNPATGEQTAEVAFAILDRFQGHGIGNELLAYMVVLGKKSGLHGFTADVLLENPPRDTQAPARLSALPRTHSSSEGSPHSQTSPEGATTRT